MPCRPEGPDKPQECCRFNIASDPGEDEPEVIDDDTCEEFKREALTLYRGHSTSPETSVAKTCQKEDGQWKYPTIGCMEFEDYRGFTRVPQYGEFDADKYSLWTQCE
jgi:hypothetical protein